VAQLSTLGIVMRMKTSTHRRLGGALIGLALITGVALHFLGVSLISAEHSNTHVEANGDFMWSGMFDLRWPLVAPLAVGSVGLILLLKRRHEKTNA
jgi:hypothetical protein